MKSREESSLCNELYLILKESGFLFSKKNNIFYKEIDRFAYVVGLRQSRSDKNDFAVFFGVWAPEFESSNAKESFSIDALRSIDFMLQISPVAPFQNTYWWRKDESSADVIGELKKHIIYFAFPYFSTFKNFDDIVYFVNKYSDDFSLKEKFSLRGDSSSFFQSEEKEKYIFEKFSFLEEEGFVRSGMRFWRKREDVFDIVNLIYYGHQRFLNGSIVSWHPVLENSDKEVDVLPKNITPITWRQLVDENDVLKNFVFLGKGTSEQERMDLFVKESRSRILDWFSKINNKNDVINSIRPEYLAYYHAKVV